MSGWLYTLQSIHVHSSLSFVCHLHYSGHFIPRTMPWRRFLNEYLSSASASKRQVAIGSPTLLTCRQELLTIRKTIQVRIHQNTFDESTHGLNTGLGWTYKIARVHVRCQIRGGVNYQAPDDRAAGHFASSILFFDVIVLVSWFISDANIMPCINVSFNNSKIP